MVSTLTKPSLGFLTICRDMGQDLKPGLDALQDNALFAVKNGYKFLEAAAFPRQMEGETTVRDFYGETVSVDWVLANQAAAKEGVKRIQDKTGVSVEALCYCANTIGNEADRKHFHKVVKAAAVLGVPNAVGFIGNVWNETAGMKGEQRRDYTARALTERLGPIVDEADSSGVNVAIENCSMRGALGYGSQSLTSNWFSTHSEIRFVLGVLPKLKMWFDPSHIRNYRAQNCPEPSATVPIVRMIQEFGKHFSGSHLKDGEDNVAGMLIHASTGDVYGDNSHTGGIWIARAPGRGQIYWHPFEGAMQLYAPQAFARSVEMEDLAVMGRAANEDALRGVKAFYQPILDRN
ncbi:TIM barrel protein [Candidatus Pacearchaeota archaeon]|nr:TIM barrel protein [Candidatus Pacearchaeota archaeon]